MGSTPPRPAAAGFTLIELLVVIGILALLAGILLPMALKAYGAGRRARTAADLQSISVALDAYKADFGDYPRVGANQAGAATLGLALIGPYGGALTDLPTYAAAQNYGAGDVAQNGTTSYVCIQAGKGNALTDTNFWIPFNTADGYPGPGFRPRAGGRVRQPYMAEGKVKTRGLDILDADGNAILYFPASLARPNVNLAKGYVAQASATVLPLYNVLDNSVAFDPTAATAEKKISAVLGDTNLNGQIDPRESAVDAPYLLWAAGPDGAYGPIKVKYGTLTPPITGADLIDVQNDVSKCDDVTNFR